MSDRKHDSRFYGTAKVGERGQVVIPSEARKELDIKTGDLLFVLAGRNRRGIAMVKADTMKELAERIMQELEVVEKESPKK